MRPLCLHQAQFPDRLPQWIRSEGTRALPGYALHNTGSGGPAHVDLLWVRRMASRGRPGHPSPGPATDTPSPGRWLLPKPPRLPLSAPLHPSSRPVPPASPLLTLGALSREGGGRCAHRALAPPGSPIPFVRVRQCQGGSPARPGPGLHTSRCLRTSPGRGRRARDSSSE